jgi:dTMP kinase
VFEGGEGAGKSTQVRLAAESLTAQGLEVVTTREPGGTPTAEVIRSVLLTPEDDPMSDRCEALLFAAARADHVAKVIRPALNQGAVVVCDRFIDSSLAYQGFARALDVAEVAQLSRWATEGLVPDLTVLLDIDPAIGVQRAKDGNRMEGEALSFHRAVRAGMRALAEREPQRYVVIDAMRSPAEIASEVSDAITQRLV